MIPEVDTSNVELQKLLEEPALDPPYGVEIDLSAKGTHSVGYALLVSACVLSTIAVFVRLGVRLALKRVGIADILTVCALGLFAGEAYLIYEVSIFPGLGVHQWNIQLKEMFRILYYVHIGSIFYGLIVMCLKIAILLDWLQLFVPLGQRGWLFWTFHSIIWANIIFYVSGNFVEIWRCSPREKIWNPLYEGGSCPINIGANNFASGIINIISDIIILVLPQWVIWNLHTTRAKRLGVSLLFLIGLFACVSATVRLLYLVRLMLSQDITYYTTFVALWGVAETTVGFLILGIPSLLKAFQSLPFLDSVTSFLRSLKKSSDSHGSPRSISRPRTIARKRRDQWEIPDLDTYDLVTVRTQDTQ